MRAFMLVLAAAGALLLAACQAPVADAQNQNLRGPYIGGMGGVNFR